MDGVYRLALENLSSSTLKLPDGLEYNFQDSKGLTYSAQFTQGGGQSLLPEQPVKATLQAAVPASLETKDLALLFSPKGKMKTTILGSLNAAKSFSIGKIGDKTEYPNLEAEGHSDFDFMGSSK